jgi:DNA/RNA-binding domain of Phe-tRNA-synthetase-like protein
MITLMSSTVPTLPQVRFELERWRILWIVLRSKDGSGAAARLLHREAEAVAKSGLTLEGISQDPVIFELRRLFRVAGCDPSRYRPASEALLRRILKGATLPSIHPLVDFNNALSLRLFVPCCVMADGTFHPPFVWRSGRAGEMYESLKGPFHLEGKPLLLDRDGPLDTPVTGNARVAVRDDTTSAWLAAYLPAAAVSDAAALSAAESLAAEANDLSTQVLGVSGPEDLQQTRLGTSYQS